MDFLISNEPDDVYIIVVEKLPCQSDFEVIHFDENNKDTVNFTNLQELVKSNQQNLIDDTNCEKKQIYNYNQKPFENEMEIKQKDVKLNFFESDYQIDSAEEDDDPNSTSWGYDYCGDISDTVRINVSDLRFFSNDYPNEKRVIIEEYVLAMNEAAISGLPPLPKLFYTCVGDTFTCIHCPHTSKTEHGSIKHYRYIHGPKHHQCLTCCSSFKRLTSLLKHENDCSEDGAEEMRAARMIYNKLKPKREIFRKLKTPCGVCKKFISRKNMNLHMDVHKEEKKFKCEQCPAEFRTWRALRAHVNCHAGCRPYQCDMCPQAYTSDTALRAHKLDHFGRSFICDVCNRTFKRKDSLKGHMKMHEELSAPDLCGECGHVSRTRLERDRHANTHATRPRLRCADCDKTYTSVNSLNYHMKNSHGKQIMTKKMFYNQLPKMDVSSVAEFFRTDSSNK